MFAQHRENIAKAFPHDLVFLKGGESECKFDSDTDIKFRQESNFFYLTGCLEPDCCCLIDCETKEFTLFAPLFTLDDELWIGHKKSLQEQKELYSATRCLSLQEMPAFLEKLKDRTCHVILDIPQIKNTELPFTNIKNDLQPAIAELRVIKDEKELEDLKISCEINAKAFNYTMSHFKAGMKEYEAEAMHAYIYLKHGARFPSFCAITAAGSNASTLHFVDNVHTAEPGTVFEIDAGCEYRNACSDCTRTFPTGEKFTQKQEELYNVVLACQKKGIEMAAPGVKWEDVHMACLGVLLEGLRKYGIVKKEGDFDEQMKVGIPSIFQPHGLGHLLGLNTHDVGGYND